MFFVFTGAVLVVFGLDFLEIWAQYNAWEQGHLTRFLLPGFQEGYFTKYSFFRILLPDVLALVASLIILIALKWLNKIKGFLLFEPEEPGIAALSILFVGYPGWVIYIPVILVVYLSWHLYVRLKGDKEARLPLYSLWPASGVLTILLIQAWIADSPLWALLKI